MNYFDTNGQAVSTATFRLPAAFWQTILWLTLCGASTAWAQTTAFTYQGKLTDAGNPANGNYDLQIKLFDALAGGAQQGATIVRTPVVASAGNFSVTLDFGVAAFPGADRFLEIGVRPAGSANAYTILAPRQPITSAPYAIQTLNTQQLGGLPANRYIASDVNGNVGIGISPTTKLHVLQSAAGTTAIYGESASGPAVYGKSTGSRGVYGESNSFTGVWGASTSSAGVLGTSTTGYGVQGTTASANGFSGYFTNTGGGSGVYSETTTGRAIWGKSVSSRGVYGESVSNVGVWGVSNSSTGVIGNSTTGYGVSGSSASANGFGGHFSNTGGGKALRVDGTGSLGVVEITGGSDLAEKFEVEDETMPGMVVVIDPKNTGRLAISRGAYNRRVAGIVSGANNLSAGMVLPDLASIKTTFAQPIALSGRVWVYCDATKNPIRAGDLLTTATTPGHAMKVVNHARAQGAIIGKAMTELKAGKGLVLVLVSLQ